VTRTNAPPSWEDFSLELTSRELAGDVLPPQLILCCQDGSMAERLARGIPQSARSLADGEAEVIEFGSRQAAVRVPLQTGEDIVRFIAALPQGDYGNDRLVIKNGIALRLPVSDRQALRKLLGIEQILFIGSQDQLLRETFVLW
jgi:hypothetical protein